MLKPVVLLTAALVAIHHQVVAQAVPRPAYMQLFYEGAGWLAGRPVVHYSPAFQGKTGEVVQEDSTRFLSPGALLIEGPAQSGLLSTQRVDSQGNVTYYVPDKNGKMRVQTTTDRQQARNQEKAAFNRQLNLLDTRAALGRTALINALNAAAADGWEVVQMTSWGGKDGLVYLLRKR